MRSALPAYAAWWNLNRCGGAMRDGLDAGLPGGAKAFGQLLQAGRAAEHALNG